MTNSVVVLAYTTAVDTAAVRRLTGYGNLDDAGVARALEQQYRQRWGQAELPDHLRRVDRLAALTVTGGQPSVVTGLDSTDERTILQRLFAEWPVTENVLIDWDGATHAVLTARSVAHGLIMPSCFQTSAGYALDRWVAPDSRDGLEAAARVEAETLALMFDDQPLMHETETFDVLERAIARYRVWLRCEYCRGRIDDATRAQYESRLNPQRLAEAL